MSPLQKPLGSVPPAPHKGLWLLPYSPLVLRGAAGPFEGLGGEPCFASLPWGGDTHPMTLLHPFPT